MMGPHREHTETKYRDDLKKIFYKNETAFKFEKYLTKLKKIFNVLLKYGSPLVEEKNLEQLLDKITYPYK